MPPYQDQSDPECPKSKEAPCFFEIMRSHLLACQAKGEMRWAFARNLAERVERASCFTKEGAPSTSFLTRLIWSIQKHLIPSLSSLEMKSPFDHFGTLDKLILKIQLELTATKKLSYLKLKREVKKKVLTYINFKAQFPKAQLRSALWMLFSTKKERSFLTPFFSDKKARELESLITHFIELSMRRKKSLERPEALFEQLFALLLLSENLPKGLSTKELSKAFERADHPSLQSSEEDSSLFLFMRALSDLIGSDEVKREERALLIYEGYQKARTLSSLSQIERRQLPLYIWKMIEKNFHWLSSFSPSLLIFLEEEINSALIDHPEHSYEKVMSSCLQKCKKILKLSFQEESLDELVSLSAAQNDMLLYAMHFDAKSPLLKLLKERWPKEEEPLDPEQLIEEVSLELLKGYAHLSLEKKLLVRRLTILMKYLWYHQKKDEHSTYQRFLSWHELLLKKREPNLSELELEEALKELSEELVPLFPFEPKGRSQIE